MTPSRAAKSILIVEDDPDVRMVLELTLKTAGYHIECAVDGDDALRRFDEIAGQVGLVVLDLMMPGPDGIEVVKRIRQVDPVIPIIVTSGICTPQQAAEAIKSGAHDFLAKPFYPEQLRRLVAKMMDSRPPSPEAGERISGMDAIEAALDQISASDVPVMLRGESGVGKEVLARKLHARSRRASGEFVKINCAALPPELLESELFGHERGAFTGADQQKIGMFEVAHGGILMLDEIGDMDARLQAKLLQVLQDHEFRRVGGRELVRVDVRILSATHRDLEKMIETGEFRSDLYYRLNVITLRVPPLRERRRDILPLARQFWVKHSTAGAEPEIPPLMEKALFDYDWPGNIRELENVIRRFLVLQNADLIALELNTRHRPLERNAAAKEPSRPSNSTGAALHEVEAEKREAESQLILEALNATNWNRRKAAAKLQIDYRALLYKMKRLSIAERQDKAITPSLR
jgi:two-component system, NtrC family, response regulator AtoC